MEYDPVQAAALMRRTPSVLRAMLEGLPDVWLDGTEGPGTWSPREVACHLADLEGDRWIQRVRTVLEQGPAQPLAPVERERFRARYAGTPLPVVLDDFEAARGANLEALAELVRGGADLSTLGSHPALGAVSASHLLSAWAVHDLTHLAQITRTLAAQYREAVGPIGAYLSILTR